MQPLSYYIKDKSIKLLIGPLFVSKNKMVMKKKSDKTSNRIKKSFTIVVFHNQENKRMSIQEYI